MSGTPLHSWYGYSVGLPQNTIIDASGNITTSYANFNYLYSNVAQFNHVAANSLDISGNLSVSGNIIGNVVGKLQSPGADTWVLYTIGGNASSKSNFTFNPSINFLHVSNGNLCVDDGDSFGSIYGSTSGNVLTVTYISPGTQLYIGSKIIGPGLDANITTIANYFTGNGGVGTYLLSSNVQTSYSNTTFNFTNNNSNNTSGLIIGKYFWGDGSNITNVAATTAGTVTSSSQPNITSVGTLTSLSVSNIANVNLPGGSNGQVLLSTGNGGVVWSNIAAVSGGIANGTSNVTIANINGPVTISANNTANIVVINGPNATNGYPNVVINGELWVSGNIFANYFDGDGSRLSNINAANIVGNLTLSGSFLVTGRSDIKTITISSGVFNLGTRTGNMIIAG